MTDKTYVTKTVAVRVYNRDRSQVVDLFGKGVNVPADADPSHLQHLLDIDAIEEGTHNGGLEVDPDVAPPFALPEGDDAKTPRKATPAKQD